MLENIFKNCSLLLTQASEKNINMQIRGEEHAIEEMEETKEIPQLYTLVTEEVFLNSTCPFLHIVFSTTENHII